MYERILVPLDGSEVAEVALPYAEQLAGRLGSQIILMSVSRSTEEQDQQVLRSYLQKTVEATREKAARYLEKPAGEAMGYFAGGVALKFKYSNKMNFWDNARKLHRKVKPLYTNKNMFKEMLKCCR